VTPVVWTVGHSTRGVETLIELLREHRVDLLLDVRTVPRSRHNPQFNADVLPAALEPAGIEHRHEPGLGGLRKPRHGSVNTGWQNAGFRGYADHMQSDVFAERLAALIALGRERRPAVMCAEAVPWRCHRSLIADALVVHGVEVRHILDRGRVELHRLTPFARVDGITITYPGLV
jgi:uncharacterized protein (DUF488 family)